MKALKNDSTAYTKQIISAITDCYKSNAEPSNAVLMELYSFIGQCICEQGEKAFVVHLAQALAEQLPQIKGLSPRNLRRMRDFYRTYENQPELMHKAQALGWTQNAVILDCCETDEQRTFYIALATKNNLSKLALIKAIETTAFETALSIETAQDTVATVCHAVNSSTTEEAVDTSVTTETACGAFVTACEPPRQGSDLAYDEVWRNTSFCGDIFGKSPKPLNTKNPQQKRSSCPTHIRSVELLPRLLLYIDRITQWLHLCESHPIGHSPPRWCAGLEYASQSMLFV